MREGVRGREREGEGKTRVGGRGKETIWREDPRKEGKRKEEKFVGKLPLVCN